MPTMFILVIAVATLALVRLLFEGGYYLRVATSRFKYKRLYVHRCDVVIDYIISLT